MTAMMPPVAEVSPAVLRILDANLDRAREGIRTLEEWCRFGLNQGELTAVCKDLRQELGQWHSDRLRQHRDTPGDPGTDLTHPQETQRDTVAAILQANFCRVQEALRVLEEYGKVYDPAFSAACKQMRYRIYTLESAMATQPATSSPGEPSPLKQDRLRRLRAAQVYLITTPREDILTQVESALKGGIRLVQYRQKTGDDRDRLPLAQALCDLCRRYQALFLINDRVDLALAVGADGVHLGQQDLPIAVARRLLGPEAIIGRSTTNPEQLATAIAEAADYVGVGPVYPTPTKPGRPAAGLDYVRHAVIHATLPWFAIGGIDGETLAAVQGAGARQVAIVRAVMDAADPEAIARHLVAQMATTPPLDSPQGAGGNV